MRVMFTVFYLTIGFNGLSRSARPCSQVDPGSLTMDQVEGIVYALASDKGVLPSVILSRLLRKVRIKQRAEKTRQKNQLQQLAMDELINSESSPRRPPIHGGYTSLDHIPPASRPLFPITLDSTTMVGAPLYSRQRPQQMFPSGPVVPSLPQQQAENVMTGMFLPPAFPPQFPHQMAQSGYTSFPNLSPPPGVTIRVKAENFVNTIPEVTVTLSPMMTIVEALKQAESKFRSVLGLSPMSEAEVISFSHSPYAECYVIQNFDAIKSSENGFWKIIVNDVAGKIIYDSVCLPSRNEVVMKPGMTITLLYTVA